MRTVILCMLALATACADTGADDDAGDGEDAGPFDAGPELDGGHDDPDAGMDDAGMGDAGTIVLDAAMSDAGMSDAGMSDAGMSDGGMDAGMAMIDGGRDAGMMMSDAGRDAGMTMTGCTSDYGFSPDPIRWSIPRMADFFLRETVDTSWATIDITADGIPDLVFTDLPAPGVGDTHWVVYPGGTSGFGAAMNYTIPRPVTRTAFDQPTVSYATIDLTGDGRIDLVFTDDTAAGVGDTRWLVYAGGATGFGASTDWPIPRPVTDLVSNSATVRSATIDMNADGRPDLLFTDDTAAGVGTTRWLVYPNTGTGFGAATDYTLPRPADRLFLDTFDVDYGTIDLDADGYLDLVVTNDTAAPVGMTHWLLYPGGPTGFGASTMWTLPRAVMTLSSNTATVAHATFDLTGDGRLDLVFTDDTPPGAGSTRWILYPGGTSGFGAAIDWTIPRMVPDLASMSFDTTWDTFDMTDDARPDLVFANDPMPGVGTSEWLVYPQCGGLI